MIKNILKIIISVSLLLFSFSCFKSEQYETYNYNNSDTDTTTQTSSCGNGIKDTVLGEECDDGNNVDGDGCSSSCLWEGSAPVCGNGVCEATETVTNCLVDCGTGGSVCGNSIQEAGEVCDEGGVQTVTCEANCTLPSCGDGITNALTGEQCDTFGFQTAGCETNCLLPACGDSIINLAAGESCDSGGVQTSLCEADCSSPVCGDSVTNTLAGESCDSGGVQTALCEADCSSPVCGDNVTNTLAGEACDSGGVQTSLCEADCSSPVCGDNVTNTLAGEACDSGGVQTALCEADCSSPVCGDSVTNTLAGESCDSGGVQTSLCEADCSSPVCGDSVTNTLAGESCDSGGVQTSLCEADCSSPVCGDSVTNTLAGEACDSGGVQTSLCEADCSSPVCGDNVTNTLAGEACDSGGIQTALCEADCSSPVCGDSVTNTLAGESCDSGGVQTSLCEADCSSPVCGDSVINTLAGEACDSGGVQTSLCEADCSSPVCGDNVTNTLAGESCDSGGVQTALCEADCSSPVCGDSVTNTLAGESCDSGGVQTALCEADCMAPTCGDGVANNLAGEACDTFGLQTSTCEADCSAPSCGDGILNLAAGEICDDGNTITEACLYGETSCTICDSSCANIAGATSYCGDFTVDGANGENCDDGNTVTEECPYGSTGCTVCDTVCLSVSGITSYCGDGFVDAANGEACDGDGAGLGGETATCNTDCTVRVCGDSIVNATAGETCDDGNAITEECPYGSTGCTVCDAFCNDAAGATSYCSDSITDGSNGETCDDGNTVTEACLYGETSCTVCNDVCVSTAGATSFCGDSSIDGSNGENCDDGNAITEACLYGETSCTVCNDLCVSTAGATSYCGDTVTDGVNGETCDDGNTVTETCLYGQTSCTVCNATCDSTPGATSFCGDSTIDAGNGENCDDGNAITESCAYGLTSCTVCDSVCSSIAGAVSYCGDSVIDGINGETCDDGNTITESCTYGDTSCTVCDAVCASIAGATSFCGDGIIDTINGETCDDSNTLAGDGCSSVCAIEWGTNPIVTDLTITGTPTGGTGNYQAGDSVTISWTASDSDGIFGYMVMLMPDIDFQNAPDGPPPAVYSTGFDMDEFLPGSTTSHTFTLPDAYGQSYYPAIFVIDNNFMFGNGGVTIALFDSINSGSNFSLLLGDPDDPASPYIESTIPVSSISYEPNGYFCSDGSTQLPEQCDDSNLSDGDGCSSSCLLEPPGTVCTMGTHPLQNISTSMTALDVGLGEKATITLTADYSCIESAEVQLYEPISMEYKYIQLKQTGIGIFEAEFPENIYLSDGTWEVQLIYIMDADYTNTYYYTPSISAPGFYAYEKNWTGSIDTTVPLMNTITTTGGVTDTTAPVMNSIVVTGTPSGANYQIGDKVTITANITDDLSGIGQVFFSVPDIYGNNHGVCLPTLVAPDTYECQITLGGEGLVSPADIYASVFIEDVAGNNEGYFYVDFVSPVNYTTMTTFSDSGIAINFLTMDVPMPPMYATLIVNAPELTATVSENNIIWFDFDVIAGKSYVVHWNDTSEGDGSPTADVFVEGYDANNNWILGNYMGYINGSGFTAFASGKVYLKVEPYSDGDFGIWVREVICGDTLVDFGEGCDDGNIFSNDGCSNICQPDTDMKPPTIDLATLTFSGTPTGPMGGYQVGDQVTISADVYDYSGLSIVDFYIDDDNITNNHGSCSAINIGGNTWECTITLSNLTYTGTESIRPYAQDTWGNTQYYYMNSGMSPTDYIDWSTGLSVPYPIVFVPFDEPPCGNTVLEPAFGETCDDGNTFNGDGCSASCQIETVDPFEPADDTSAGATPIVLGTTETGHSIDIAGDEDYYIFTVADGQTVYIETSNGSGGCDMDTYLYLYDTDGITLIDFDDDGGFGLCSLISYTNVSGLPQDLYFMVAGYSGTSTGAYVVTIVSPVCGNNEVEISETCDDGNTTPGDGCDEFCQIEPVCGNSVVEPGETCDDGNTVSNDGCAASCYDITPPVVNFGTLNVSGIPTGIGGNYVAGDVITVSVNITDESAVNSVSFSVSDDVWNYHGGCGATNVSGNNWECSFSLTNDMVTGTEYIYIYIEDVHWNSDTFYMNSGFSVTNYYQSSTGLATSDPIMFVPYEKLPIDLMVNGGYQVIDVNSQVYAKFNVTSGNTYTIYWDDWSEGSGFYFGDIMTSAYYFDMTPIFELADSGYFSGQAFMATQSGEVYIILDPMMIGSVAVMVDSIDEPPPVLLDNFETGTFGSWVATGLWHISTVRSSDGVYSARYADDITGADPFATYDTGAANSGIIESSSFVAGSTLAFDYFLDNECGFGSTCGWDTLKVYISSNGGASWDIVDDLPNNAASGILQSRMIDTSAYNGMSINIKFQFDTGDSAGNAYEGAYIDNIRYQ
ncbi:MAG: DUF4215 domain-containing protein [Spirochaetia bacterium]|nr:DUF4215 domain-containing protein [Spirochaetia bacterium]